MPFVRYSSILHSSIKNRVSVPGAGWSYQRKYKKAPNIKVLDSGEHLENYNKDSAATALVVGGLWSEGESYIEGIVAQL